MSDALAYLIELIADGMEFPDAQWKASQRYKVPAETLTEEYDNLI